MEDKFHSNQAQNCISLMEGSPKIVSFFCTCWDLNKIKRVHRFKPVLNLCDKRLKKEMIDLLNVAVWGFTNHKTLLLRFLFSLTSNRFPLSIFYPFNSFIVFFFSCAFYIFPPSPDSCGLFPVSSFYFSSRLELLVQYIRLNMLEVS